MGMRLFKDPAHRQDDVAAGSDFPPAQLSLSHMIGQADAAGTVHRQARMATFADRYHEWREHASLWLSGLDLAPDLAVDIGSKRWLRGAATLIGLTSMTLLAWPGFSPVEAAPAMTIDDGVRDEMRSQMIMPLALGADSGRKMGATATVVQLASAPERPQLDVVATLTQGDSFDRMLRRAGVSEGEAGQVASMVATAVPLDQISSGTQIDITLGRRPAAGQPRPLDALSFRARFDLELGVERRNGSLALDPRTARPALPGHRRARCSNSCA
jgi:hypothetical protein